MSNPAASPDLAKFYVHPWGGQSGFFNCRVNFIYFGLDFYGCFEGGGDFAEGDFVEMKIITFFPGIASFGNFKYFFQIRF